jgi:hypothetical protein
VPISSDRPTANRAPIDRRCIAISNFGDKLNHEAYVKGCDDIIAIPTSTTWLCLHCMTMPYNLLHAPACAILCAFAPGIFSFLSLHPARRQSSH